MLNRLRRGVAKDADSITHFSKYVAFGVLNENVKKIQNNEPLSLKNVCSSTFLNIEGLFQAYKDALSEEEISFVNKA